MALVYDAASAQWIDDQTGQPVGPSGSTTNVSDFVPVGGLPPGQSVPSTNYYPGGTTDQQSAGWAPTQSDQPDGGSGGGGANNSGFSWPTYQGPSPYQFQPFSFSPYQQLSAEDAAKTPGYSFARDQGRDAILTNKAAMGTARSGGTLKDIFAWGDQFAAQNYQQAEANNQRIYGMNRDNAFGNWYGNQTQGLATWQANNQPSQFGSSQGQQQAAMTFADLYNRYKAGLDATTSIATAGAV